MKRMPHPDMLKATELTRKGRLAEATRLIQRLLHGGTPDSITKPDVPQSPSGRTPITIDGTAERIEEVETAGAQAVHGTKSSSDRLASENDDFASPPPAQALQGVRNILGRYPDRRQPARRGPVEPSGAEFLARRFKGVTGSRDYKLYIPSCYRGDPLPLIVMLHGCTQSADDFASGTRMNEIAEENGFLVGYPIQANAANGSGCWNWFKPEDQRRNHGEPSLIAGITQEIVGNYKVDPGRIYVAGLSAGGAVAAIMGATYPDVYAAIGVHSGLPVGAASDLPSALAAMRQGSPGSRHKHAGAGTNIGRPVPAIVFHGDRDTTVHPSNGAHIIEQIRSTRASELRAVTHHEQTSAGRSHSVTSHLDVADCAVIEMWLLHGAKHAWSGGSSEGSYTDPLGPDASREMARFFLQHSCHSPAP